MTQFFRNITTTIAMLVALWVPVGAQNTISLPNTKNPNDSAATATDIKVSLITFYPGDEIFEVFGHSEILVTDSKHSYFFNYGVFDFNSPNFLGRYIMGETDYMCAIMPPAMDGGVKPGRKMIKQDLNLTPEQAQQVLDMLLTNARRENCVYRYRHFSDNCSTRPRDIIEKAIGHEIDYSKCDYVVGKTLRQIMTHYTRNYPWEQFGIDLALGAVCDTVVDARTQTFVPLFLMNAYSSVEIDNGNGPEKLVKATEVMIDGDDNGIVLPPTPWYKHPLTIAIILLIITAIISYKDWKCYKVSRWYDTLLFTVTGLAGCIIFFVEFISTHEAVMPNYNILWLHPLLLTLAILPWIKKAENLLRWSHFINIALIATMAVVWISGLQVANAAFYPIVASTLLRSLVNVRKQ